MSAIHDITEFIDETTDMLRSHVTRIGLDLEYWEIAQRRTRECKEKFLTSEHKPRVYKQLTGYYTYLLNWIFDYAHDVEDNDREMLDVIRNIK